MTKRPGTLRICPRGHRYYKSSACPVCPLCEIEHTPTADFLIKVSAPARRALERENIQTLEQLASWTEQGLLKLHGIGPRTIPPLRDALTGQGLKFRE
ncbi:MAG: hypothetical protein KDC28_11655 [Saprospiraceae bacterium]|nr:hypothetical protein [Saprospiraceae bacterium]MCB9321439.1 hypothetical protein [Lewinellaceae bacterium]